ncbi:MAG TPA: hypothetical protein DIW30_07145 [Bacteroidales bacterium]|nr:hypothetical protein [Bacteroidales bacterium]
MIFREENLRISRSLLRCVLFLADFLHDSCSLELTSGNAKIFLLTTTPQADLDDLSTGPWILFVKDGKNTEFVKPK